MRVSEKLAYSCLAGTGIHSCKHHAKRGAVGEMVPPADELCGGRVAGLLDWLGKNQRAEAWEDFEQRHLWDADAPKAPCVGVNKREAEDVISDCADEAAERAEDD